MASDIESPATADGSVSDIVWDGRVHSYRPPEQWREAVQTKLPMHTEADEDIDPVTYQVIRNRLYMINLAHGETVTRISGSPVFQSLDFNMCILNEAAEYVMNAPFIQFLNAGASFGVQYIMEQLGEDPGINDGDVFICNDPWIAAVHEPDVLFTYPVFVDGKLFAWTANAGHQYDFGGIEPGGWPQNAVDVFSDPTILTPLKLVDRGRLRPEIEAVYLRQSRTPDMVALDMRAQIAGCRFAGEQLLELCEQFGPAVVKGAMRKVLDTCQESLKSKLRKIPDGVWSQVSYVTEKLPGDRGAYRLQVNVTKAGDRLTIDNKGSEAQTEGPNGMTYCAFAGAAMAALTPTLLHEQLFAIGGAYRQIDIDLTPGLLNCADHPAAVSAGTTTIIEQIGAVLSCINRMLACDPGLAENIVAPSPSFFVPVVNGRTAGGEFYGSVLFDWTAPGLGARAFQDGVNTAGHSWTPLTLLINVENAEQWYPMVYLYRRELTDSGGAGRWRAGVGLEYGFMPYEAQSMNLVNFGGGMSGSAFSAPGALGGMPAPSTRALVRRNTNVYDCFASRRIPANVDDLEADTSLTRPQKANAMALGPTDVAEYSITGGGGYGDPLEREPRRVEADVADGYVSAEAASSIYGVALTGDGALDPTRTARLRDSMRQERAAWPRAADRFPSTDLLPAPATGEAPRKVHEALVARDEGDRRVICCDRCGTVICGYAEDFKRHVLMHEGPTTAIVGGVGDPTERLDVPVVLRRYCCPGCSVLLTTEVARAGDVPWPDMRLRVVAE